MKWRPALATAIVIASACRTNVPMPPSTSQPTSALIEVDYPPPPARVEILPRRPDGDAVWVQGEWLWAGRRWSWRPGMWVIPPKGALYAPQVRVRRFDGKLYVASGTWRDPDGGELIPPPTAAVAAPLSGAVVNAEGEPEPTAADVPADGGADGADGRLSMPKLDQPSPDAGAWTP